MIKVLLVGIGGCVGSIARYWLSELVQVRSAGTFPSGTLAVNVLGCFLIGGFAELADTRGLFSAEARTFAVIGLLGGFTTFSAFGNETMNLLRDRDYVLAVVNVTANVLLAVGAVWLGRVTASRVWR